MQPGWTGEPPNAPAWYLRTAWAAVMRPSFVTPIFTRTLPPEVGPEARKTSVRLMVILTGWHALRERPRASGSRYTTVLPPKPPPISDGVTRIFETSMPSSFAQ